MPFDAAGSDWRGDPMPSRPRRWLRDVLDSLMEMALTLVALLLAFSVAFAVSAAIYGLPDFPPIGADTSKLPPIPVGSQIVSSASFFLVLAGFFRWRWRQLMAKLREPSA